VSNKPKSRTELALNTV